MYEDFFVLCSILEVMKVKNVFYKKSSRDACAMWKKSCTFVAQINNKPK